MTLPPPPPFRAEHVGSLKRPRHLIDARAKLAKGEITAAELESIEDREIGRIVKMQQRLGFKAITDGEFRRHMFYDGFFNNLEGITHLINPDQKIFMNYNPAIAVFKKMGTMFQDTYVCTGKIRRTKPCYVPWFTALAKEVAPEDVKYLKLSMCAPTWYHCRHGPKYAYSEEAYATDAEYFADVAKAYREEITALYDAGCRNIQIDDPTFVYFCSTAFLDGLKEEGIDPDELLDAYIKLHNDCLRDKKPDMNVGVHLCRGNFKDSVHFVEGSYDAIAVKLFNELNFNCYYLEYDTPRAGSFEPLRALPQHKRVVLGLISSKVADLEDKKQIIARLDEAARIMDDPLKERICLSPQCGFASHIAGNKVSEVDMEKKLALVVEIATDVWGTAQ